MAVRISSFSEGSDRVVRVEGRLEATGRGVMVVLEEALKEHGKSWRDIRVAVQGFGNVGSNAARLIAEQGARIV